MNNATYVPAAERSRSSAAAHRRASAWPPPVFITASLVAALAIVLTYAGRVAEPAALSGANINRIASAGELEPLLAPALADPAERRAAAQGLFAFLIQHREQHGPLPNVGSMGRARMRGTTDLAVPVLSASQLATVKPSLVVRTVEEFRNNVLLYGLLYLCGFQVAFLLFRLRRINVDVPMFTAAHLLTAIGFAALLARPDALRDTFLVARYTEGILLGLAVMVGLSMIDFRTAAGLELSYLPLAAALGLSLVVLTFGSGPSGSNAKVNLGPVQPIEAIRFLLALFLAGYFARHWELLRTSRETAVGRLRMPSWEYVLPVAAGVALALLFFVLQKDLGPALYTCAMFLAIYAIARGRVAMAVAGLAAVTAAFYLGHALQLSSTLVARVSMWRSPWNNQVPGGDQIAHALWGMSAGGTWGTGPGLGSTRYLPAGHTDLVLAAIGEELGVVGLFTVAGFYAVIAWRGLRTGRLAANDYGFFLATAMTLFLVVPVFIMAAGVVGAAPLTGVVTPFLSYGGSAMVTNFAALGILTVIHADPRPALDFTPFRVPVRWLSGACATCAVVLAAWLLNVQVLNADDYVVRPHLGVQADGGRRFAYNPRVLDVVRRIPRGSVYDRAGRPLATDDVTALRTARDAYQKLGVSIDAACPDQGVRCYPLGGRAFHLLGDAQTRVNWAAANTSYIERDAEDRLRGFDDHATTVDGALRRDYSELVPLLRNRGASMPEFLGRPRDVRLTVDAALQLRASSIVANYAGRSSGKGAAVVVDADTGELLASVSYPWPASLSIHDAAASDSSSDAALLDRARYGLYPPGSTFKLVTAAAALREHGSLQRSIFACSKLPDGRSGARIPGWTRPIRDDVLDAHPHGRIGLRDGLVRSCNAYFAQLAARLGPDPLLTAAGELGIALTQNDAPRRRVAETLPQIGYGQGDVLATPLRMARVAAAIASDGRLRDVSAMKAGAPGHAKVFLDTEAARLLARYMREAVLNGTGRTLREHPSHIAGKTGTAEVSGKPSHSWFVGFAPYGASTRRIAFAVIIENAGYGSANAAPAAAEIVSAAAAAGLLN